MGEEVDIFMAQLVRRRADQPWGFRIEGGYDTHAPLRIALVRYQAVLDSEVIKYKALITGPVWHVISQHYSRNNSI